MRTAWSTTHPRWLTAFVFALILPLLTSHRNCFGQANVEIEIEHLWRLQAEGQWLEALDETKALLAMLEKNGADEGGPMADTFLTFAVFRASFASNAGALADATEIFEIIEDLSKKRSFTTALALNRPRKTDDEEASKKRLFRYQQMVDLRNFYLLDAQIRSALAKQQYDLAENLVATSIRARRSSSSRAAMLRDENREGRILSPKQLAELSTFQPHHQATLLYLAEKQPSRAKTYFTNMIEDAERAVFEAFHDTNQRGADQLALCPEWPSGARSPSSQQREAARLRALVEDTRGRLALVHDDLTGADTAFTAALDYWQRAYGGDHPEAISTMISSAEIALQRVRDSSNSRDAKTSAVRARKAERLLKTAEQLAEPALVATHPDVTRISELLAEAQALTSASEVNFADLEAAERAATDALRSMARFVVSQQSIAAGSAAAKPDASPAAAASD